jgi:hypothetical protein
MNLTSPKGLRVTSNKMLFRFTFLLVVAMNLVLPHLYRRVHNELWVLVGMVAFYASPLMMILSHRQIVFGEERITVLRAFGLIRRDHPRADVRNVILKPVRGFFIWRTSAASIRIQFSQGSSIRVEAIETGFRDLWVYLGGEATTTARNYRPVKRG